jgi:hypothetical protein
MAALYRSRLVQINQVIFDQVDIFQSDFFNRVTGLDPADVGLSVYFNNTLVTWPLVDGTSVIDSQVVSGSVFWNELASGAYGVRFYPNNLGHWRLVFTFAPSPSQVISLDYDVVNLPNFVESGVRASFC